MDLEILQRKRRMDNFVGLKPDISEMDIEPPA